MSDVVYNVTIFGLNFNIKPVAFTLPFGGGWDIYWYGIIIATGFLLAIIYAWKNAERFNLDIDRLIDVILVATPVAILCARAYYLIFDGEKLSGISEFFGLDGSGFAGLAIYGGVIGAAVSAIVMCKVRKLKLLDVLDIASIGFLIGQGIGRWGNFFNQEAFGRATGSDFWGMTSENVVSELGKGKLAHPCFLYESIWCIAGFFLLHKLSKNRKFSGQIVLGYGIWYGFGRTIIEGLRTDSLYIGPFRVSQVLSFLLCVTCAVLYAVIIKRRQEAEKGTKYVPMFGDLDNIITNGEKSKQEETDSDSEDISSLDSVDDTEAYINDFEDLDEKHEDDKDTSDDKKID
ncbi:MAG: prolipoprotein diacylglyceryl transferase [Selenomonadaceae bacterium]